MPAPTPATLAAALEPARLRAAWDIVRANHGKPGVDEMSVARWARHWETNLARLREQVRANTYRPHAPRRWRVLKPGGGYREICALTVADRILQRAVLDVLTPVGEARFLNCSFGYRPQRGVPDAITAVVRARERGCRYVFDADIRACFDSLAHDVIQRVSAPLSDDTRLHALCAAWLRAGTKRRGSAVGVPLGAVLAPLWCNLVLHELDAGLTAYGWKPVRYADDFIVPVTTEADAWAVWEASVTMLSVLQLELQPAKTRVATFADGFTFLGVTFRGNQYSYTHRAKRIAVKGATVRPLRLWPPVFYGEEL